MASVYNLHYDDVTDGTSCPTNGTDIPNGGYTPTADRWTDGWTTGGTVFIDDGDLLGGLHSYGSFTARNRMIVFDNGSSGTCALQHDSFAAKSVWCDLFPIKISGAPGSFSIIYSLKNGASNRFDIQMSTGRQLRLRDASYTARYTSSTALAANTTYWLSIKVTGNASTGHMECKIISGTTFEVLETVGNQTTNWNTGGTITERRIGPQTSAGTNWQMGIGQIWSDDADHPTAPTASNLSADDIEWRLSTNSGSAGNSTAQGDPNDSLGEYMSTTEISTTTLNNLWDDISSAENTALDVEYRCIFVYNANTGASLYDTYVWIESQLAGSPTIAIALDGIGVVDGDSASAQSEEETSEGTAPTGETFTSPTTKATGLSVGTLGPEQCQAIWIRRTAIDSPDVPGAGYTLRAEGGVSA